MFAINLMRQTTFITLFLLCLTPCLSFAQQSTFIDLGVVRGEFRQITHAFDWTNTFNRAVTISLNSLDTALHFDPKRQQIDSGAMAVLSVQLQLPKPLGYYTYDLNLIDEQGLVLHSFQLGAQVIASPDDVFDTYDETHWPFKTKQKVFNLGIGRVGDTLSKTFDVYNFGGQAVKLNQINNSDTLLFAFRPKTIEHHYFGKMTISYVPTDSASMGFSKVLTPLVVQGKTESFFPLQFTVLPRQDTSQKEGPRLVIDKISHDFKEVQGGKVVSALFQISNEGNEELNLLKLQSNCSCLTYELPQYGISPNQSVELIVFFDTANRKGFEKKTLALFSNDNRQPTQVIEFQISVR